MVREPGIHPLSLSLFLLSSCCMDSGCSGWSMSSHIRPSGNALKMAEKQDRKCRLNVFYVRVKWTCVFFKPLLLWHFCYWQLNPILMKRLSSIYWLSFTFFVFLIIVPILQNLPWSHSSPLFSILRTLPVCMGPWHPPTNLVLVSWSSALFILVSYIYYCFHFIVELRSVVYYRARNCNLLCISLKLTN